MVRGGLETMTTPLPSPFVVFPDGFPPEHPNAHAVIGRDAGATTR